MVSSDALEHVPPARRDDFVAELVRTSRELVLLGRPLRHARGGRRRGAGAAVRPARHGESPRTSSRSTATTACPTSTTRRARFADLGLHVGVAGVGNLHDWLAMMLVKHQLVARPALGPLETGYDIAYNWLFSGRDHVPPFYRHLIAAGRTAPPFFGERQRPSTSGADGVAGLLAVFTAANVAEAVRQDTDARVAATERLVNELASASAPAWPPSRRRSPGSTPDPGNRGVCRPPPQPRPPPGGQPPPTRSAARPSRRPQARSLTVSGRRPRSAPSRRTAARPTLAE